MRIQNSLAVLSLSLSFGGIASGCATEVTPNVSSGGGLPVALLSCPTTVQVGAPFLVDGAASSDFGGPFAESTLQLTPGFEPVAELSSTFTVTNPGIVTARLAVADADGNLAEARCRILVEGAALPNPDDDGDDGDDGDDDGVIDVPGEPVDLTGSFALVAYDRPELSGLSLDPDRQCAAAPHFSLVDIEQVGTSITMTSTICHLSMPSVQIWAMGIQQTEVPAAFVDAIPSSGAVAFELDRAETGVRFAPPLAQIGTSGMGAIGADDENEELPTDPNDPRVRDDDGDGAPGGTIESTWGDQQIVYRRMVRAFAGTVTSSNEIDGSLEGSWRVDGDSSLLSFFDFLVPTGAGQPSTFKMTRVDGGNGTNDLAGSDGTLTCDDVRAHMAELIAAFPPPATPDGCASF